MDRLHQAGGEATVTQALITSKVCKRTSLKTQHIEPIAEEHQTRYRSRQVRTRFTRVED